jgi:hypothetical protein
MKNEKFGKTTIWWYVRVVKNGKTETVKNTTIFCKKLLT